MDSAIELNTADLTGESYQGHNYNKLIGFIVVIILLVLAYYAYNYFKKPADKTPIATTMMVPTTPIVTTNA